MSAHLNAKLMKFGPKNKKMIGIPKVPESQLI